MRTKFTNGKFYLNHSWVSGDMLVEDGFIKEVGVVEKADTEIDLAGKRVIPGFIDIHTHGSAGVDVNAATAEELEKISCFFASQGTTNWLASVLTDTKEQTMWCIEQYKIWKQMEHNGAELMGIHLEGPFLAAPYKGAMPEHLLKAADLELLKEYQEAAEGAIKYITVSPEVEGIIEMIPAITKLGIKVAIGHSGVDYDTAKRAIANGATASTHTGNAMRLLHQHDPGIWGAVLEDEDLYCEMICDGRHLHPGTVRYILKMKGYDKAMVVTDSIMAGGLPDGEYKLGVNDVVVKDGDARLKVGDSRAGSTLTMKVAFANLLEFTEKSVKDIVPLFNENQARMLGVYDQLGSLNAGKFANFLVLGHHSQVEEVYVNGKQVGK